MTKQWEIEQDYDKFKAHGLPCAMARGPTGCWCGYVGIPREHPLFGVTATEKSDCLRDLLEQRMDEPVDTDKAGLGLMIGVILGQVDNTPESCFRVHGGITFSASWCPTGDNRADWWFGFDCYHVGDASPKPRFGLNYPDSIYRTHEYAKQELCGLAKQLSEVAAWQTS